MGELSERLAKLAGKDVGTLPDHNFVHPTSIACYRCGEGIMTPELHCTIELPDYEHSIDAQIRDLDPLVEAKHHIVEERHYPPRAGFEDHEHVFHTRSGSFVGYAPDWASARAAALEAALEVPK